MQIIDLFSGIGGFSYAGEQIPEWKTVAFCEMNQFCCDVLRKNFGYKIPIHNDVKTLTKELLQIYGWNEKETTIITGGFPCQPFSNAGLKGGEDDNRYLWPAMLRIIRETKPRFVLGENVTGIVDMVLPQIRTDLESEGYRVEMFIIPACAIGGLHRRDRVWITAYTNSINAQNGYTEFRNNKKKIHDWERKDANGFFNLSSGWKLSNEDRVCRIYDGISRGVDRSKRMESLGGSIVPQIAFILMSALNELNRYYE